MDWTTRRATSLSEGWSSRKRSSTLCFRAASFSSIKRRYSCESCHAWTMLQYAEDRIRSAVKYGWFGTFPGSSIKVIVEMAPSIASSEHSCHFVFKMCAVTSGLCCSDCNTLMTWLSSNESRTDVPFSSPNKVDEENFFRVPGYSLWPRTRLGTAETSGSSWALRVKQLVVFLESLWGGSLLLLPRWSSGDKGWEWAGVLGCDNDIVQSISSREIDDHSSRTQECTSWM